MTILNFKRLPDGTVDSEAWIQKIEKIHGPYYTDTLKKTSDCLAHLEWENKIDSVSNLEQGLEIANILLPLKLDKHTIAAAMLFIAVQHRQLSVEMVQKKFDKRVAQLIEATLHLNQIRQFEYKTSHDPAQIDKIRKLLLAIVSDVRAVLIKLAERICILRTLIKNPSEKNKPIAEASLHIYAGLANRLGIAQMKSELEDLAFRYLEPAAYKKIANLLAEKKIERESRIQETVNRLKIELQKININAHVTGRAKHIYSIHHKMQLKKLDYHKLFDTSAIRIFVDTIEECYIALSVVHRLWVPVPLEFDDYIAAPKPNGYQSIHTVVVGPEDKNLEVQIRTHEMHRVAEMGIAAHWMYKEGKSQSKNYENQITWLKQLIEWHKDVAKNNSDAELLEQRVFEDRVYVLTPEGKVIDLPKKSTPLDFAYQVHTDIGHRCKGAKVNQKLVPLTHVLKTGDSIEILTKTECAPSRDWLNPTLHYCESKRTRAKILHWFHEQDFEGNCLLGKALLEKELKNIPYQEADLEEIAMRHNFKTKEALFAAIGQKGIRAPHIATYLKHKYLEKKEISAEALVKSIEHKPSSQKNEIQISGEGDFLTRIAQCCKPIPGDTVIGYITQGRGISIHRATCIIVKNLNIEKQKKLMSIVWNKDSKSHYLIDILVEAHDRAGLLRDISNTIASENVNITHIHTYYKKMEQIIYINLSVEIHDQHQLKILLDKLTNVKNVLGASRKI